MFEFYLHVVKKKQKKKGLDVLARSVTLSIITAAINDYFDNKM